MDKREEIADKMMNHLEKKIYCDNVNGYIKNKSVGENILMVGKIPTSLKIISYNDPNKFTNLSRIFDFIMETNYTGFSYFPYLYGILDCPQKEENKLYIFYEKFDSNLTELLKNIKYAGDWYDIFFQIIMINFYIEIINGYRYGNDELTHYLYRKLPSTIEKEYDINGQKIIVPHRYLIVVWDVENMEKMNQMDTKNYRGNINHFINYIQNNSQNLSIIPSNKMMQMLKDISQNPEKTNEILVEHYKK